MVKHWYHSRTMWLNICTSGVAVTAGLSSLLPMLAPVVSESSLVWALFTVGFLNVMLRANTDKGIKNVFSSRTKS